MLYANWPQGIVVLNRKTRSTDTRWSIEQRKAPRISFFNTGRGNFIYVKTCNAGAKAVRSVTDYEVKLAHVENEISKSKPAWSQFSPSVFALELFLPAYISSPFLFLSSHLFPECPINDTTQIGWRIPSRLWWEIYDDGKNFSGIVVPRL